MPLSAPIGRGDELFVVDHGYHPKLAPKFRTGVVIAVTVDETYLVLVNNEKLFFNASFRCIEPNRNMTAYFSKEDYERRTKTA